MFSLAFTCSKVTNYKLQPLVEWLDGCFNPESNRTHKSFFSNCLRSVSAVHRVHVELHQRTGEREMKGSVIIKVCNNGYLVVQNETEVFFK